MKKPSDRSSGLPLGGRPKRNRRRFDGFLVKLSQLRLATFTILSGIGWLLDLAVLFTLIAFGASYFSASLTGAFCGVTFVFIAAQHRLYRSPEGGGIRWRLLLPYLLWQVFAIFLASLAVSTLAGWLAPHLAALSGSELIAGGIAKVIVTPVTLYANFLFFGWLAERRISWK